MSAEDPENIENRLPDPHGQNNNSDTDSVTSHSKCDKEEIKWLMAACNCEQEALTKLLQHRPELVNWQSFVDGYTALHYAAKFGSTGIVKLLLGTYKANVNIVNHAGETPLHVAYYYNQDAVKDQLEVQYRANTQVFDYSGLQPKDHRTKRLEDDRKYNPCGKHSETHMSLRPGPEFIFKLPPAMYESIRLRRRPPQVPRGEEDIRPSSSAEYLSQTSFRGRHSILPGTGHSSTVTRLHNFCSNAYASLRRANPPTSVMLFLQHRNSTATAGSQPDSPNTSGDPLISWPLNVSTNGGERRSSQPFQTDTKEDREVELRPSSRPLGPRRSASIDVLHGEDVREMPVEEEEEMVNLSSVASSTGSSVSLGRV